MIDEVVHIARTDFEQALSVSDFIYRLGLTSYVPTVKRVIMTGYVNLSYAPTEEWRQIWITLIDRAIRDSDFGGTGVNLGRFAAKLHPAIGPVSGEVFQRYQVVDA
jgi:hypothetical protein